MSNKHNYEIMKLSTLQALADMNVRRPPNEDSRTKIVEIFQELKNRKLKAIAEVEKISNIEGEISDSIMYHRKKRNDRH